MAYKTYKLSLLLRISSIFFLLLILVFGILTLDFKRNTLSSLLKLSPIVLIIAFTIHDLFTFIFRRHKAIQYFFQSLKYNDFSQWFNEKSGPEDIRELHQGFNLVNQKIKEINKDREIQYLYLEKILELIETGIVAYNVHTGDVIWINESFKDLLNIPTLKNIQFLKKRSENNFKTVFEALHTNGSTISIDTEKHKTKLLISTSHFQLNNEEFKLIVLQNIDNTLNQNQSQAWNKLLHIMTHEIMNSIAPISSLAETLRGEIKLSIEDPENHTLNSKDLYLSMNSIQKRSKGLLNFSKSYRGLNKITKIHPSKVYVRDLFDGIHNLLRTSFKSKGIDLQFAIDSQKFQIYMDAVLIEQVLINIIMNSVDACLETKKPVIAVSAKTNFNGAPMIIVTDNGRGISEELVDKIFIPFFSSKKNGSGIGLTLCQQIMFLHKGTIQVKTIENSGTAVQLLF